MYIHTCIYVCVCITGVWLCAIFSEVVVPGEVLNFQSHFLKTVWTNTVNKVSVAWLEEHYGSGSGDASGDDGVFICDGGEVSCQNLQRRCGGGSCDGGVCICDGGS